MNIVVFIHVYTVNNWFNIIKSQLERIKNSGLLNYSNVKISVNKDTYDTDINLLHSLIINYKNVEIIHIGVNTFCGECTTINLIKDYCDNLIDEKNILYIHTKGVTQYKSIRELPVDGWRNMMEYYLIDKWNDCVDKLNKYQYDCCGINYQDHSAMIDGELKLIKIFNGNFFWCKSKYVRKINKNFKFISRYSPENWILSEYHIPYIPNNDYANKDLYSITEYHYE